MAHLFFSYAHADADRIYPIHREIETATKRTLWIDRIGLREGSEWEKSIKRGIDQSYGVIFAVTKTFITRPFILQKEIPWAIEKFKLKQGKLFLVLRLDDVELPPDLEALPDYQCQVIDAYAPDTNITAIFSRLMLPTEQEGDQPFYVSWPRLENFKGRDQTLETLHNNLVGGAVGINSHVAAGAYGMGGIGKTQLAVEYAYRYRYYYPAGVYWINAAADWSQELVRVADQLALKPADASDPDRAKQKIIALIHYLRDRAVQEQSDTLIVMDNVEVPSEVMTHTLANGATMLGNAASFCTQARARLLTTTRRQDLPKDFAKVEVSVLDPLDARAVLLDARPAEQDIESLDSLCKSVGYLPLPLGWFAAALNSDAMLTPADLLTALREQKIDQVISDLIDQGVELGTPQHYVALTEIAFDWQWDQLKSEDARTVLALAAAFEEAEIIPLPRLYYLSGLPARQGTRRPFDLAIKALTNLSLIEPQEQGKALRLHPLVREFVRSKMDTQATLSKAANHLVAAYRTPAILATEAETRGFDAVLNDLRTTFANLTAPSDSIKHLIRLLALETSKLSEPPAELGSILVIQQIRDRAHHEGDDLLVIACDKWLITQPHLHHVGTSRYPRDSALLATLSNHMDVVNGVLLLPDERLLSWSSDRTLRLWSNQGQPLATFQGHERDVNGALLLPDGRLLSWSSDHTLRLWSNQGQPLAILEGHADAVRGALLLPDGRLLSWADDGTLRLWSNQGQPLAILEGHTSAVNGALALPDERLLSWSPDRILWLRSSQGQLLATLQGHTSAVNGALALPDGRLLSWSSDRTLRLWSSQGQPLAILQGHMGDVFGALALPDGRLLSWAFERTLRLWSNQGQPLAILQGHMSYVRGALLLPDGRLLSWSPDHTLRLWSSQGQGQPLATLQGHTSAVNGALLLPDGRLLSWSSDRTLRLWSNQGQPLAILEGHTSAVNGALLLPDERLLSWAFERTLRLWSSQGQPLATLQGHTSAVNGALALPDERLLSWSSDRTLWLWSNQGQPLATLQGHTDIVNGALDLSDGRLLSWSSDHTLRLWSSQGQPLATLQGHTDIVNGALLLPDERLLSWADDGTLRLWSSQGQRLASLQGHTDAVKGALLLPDERLLSWSDDGTLRLWSSQGQPLATLQGHIGYVNGGLVLSDGRLLSWGFDHTLRLWSSQGQPLATLQGHTDTVKGALELSDGRLLSWADDHTMRLWRFDGRLQALYHDDATITCCIEHSSNLVAGDGEGRVLFLRIYG